VYAFRLSSLFDVIKLRFASQAESKGLSLHVVQTQAILNSDPVILERIIANLVSNAIRYTEAGRVLVGCRRRREGLSIEVWDTGVGIRQSIASTATPGSRRCKSSVTPSRNNA
jgi:signal transduction histidine kinase